MYVFTRSVSDAPTSGVCGRSRTRTSCRTQSDSAASSRVVGRGGTSARFVSDRCSSSHRRTVVRRVAPRRAVATRGGVALRGWSSRGPMKHIDVRPCVDHTHQSVLQRLIVWYQRVVDGRPSPCRFTPSCSAYALEALELHGTWHGVGLTLRRFSRCRPFGPSGWDPVPEASSVPVGATTRKRVDAR